MENVAFLNNPMIMKKPEEILAESIIDREFGELISHDEIERIIGYPKKSGKYYSVIRSANRILRSQSKAIENVPKEGYRIIKPGDYVKVSLRHYKKGFNEIKKGKDTLDLAPVNDMTDEERAAYTRVHDRSILLHASMEGALCELKTLGVKKHPLLPNKTK